MCYFNKDNTKGTNGKQNKLELTKIEYTPYPLIDMHIYKP